MGVGDKISNKAKESTGKVKKLGDAIENERLQAEGLRDQSVATSKQPGEHLKDAATDVTGQ